MSAIRPDRYRMVVGALPAMVALICLASCSPAPVNTTKLSVTTAPDAIAPTTAAKPTTARTTAARASGTSPVRSQRRPVLTLAVPAGWQQIGLDQPGSPLSASAHRR